MATHSNGMSAVQPEAQLGITYKTAWLLAQKLRRSMIDPQREPLEGVVEVDQAELPFRADNSFFDPLKSGKILIAGAVEVIDRGTNQASPQFSQRGCFCVRRAVRGGVWAEKVVVVDLNDWLIPLRVLAGCIARTRVLG